MNVSSSPRSLEMQRRAKAVIPGGAQLLSKRPEQFAPGVWPGYFARAKGCEVWDLDGNHYLDMSISGIGAVVLGYSDPDVNAAVIDAVQRGVSTSLNCEEEVLLAERLCELHPWASRVRFARTGGEAMAVAARILRAATGRDTLILCGYHGWHDWYLAANLADPAALDKHLFSNLQPRGVPHDLAGSVLTFEYGRADQLQALLDAHQGKIAGIIMEPLRAAMPEPGFLPRVRALATEHGVPLAFDEISAGFRLTTGGAHLALGVAPDVAVFSKAMGNGHPIAAVIGIDAVMDAVERTFVSSTYWTERLGFAAGLATIDKHQREHVSDHLHACGTAVQDMWRRHADAAGLGVKIGGIVELSHFSFDHPMNLHMRSLYVRSMIEQGILGAHLYYPMLAHRPEHLQAYELACAKAFDAVARACRDGSIEQVVPAWSPVRRRV